MLMPNCGTPCPISWEAASCSEYLTMQKHSSTANDNTDSILLPMLDFNTLQAVISFLEQYRQSARTCKPWFERVHLALSRYVPVTSTQLLHYANFTTGCDQASQNETEQPDTCLWLDTWMNEHTSQEPISVETNLQFLSRLIAAGTLLGIAPLVDVACVQYAICVQNVVPLDSIHKICGSTVWHADEPVC